MLCSCLLPRLWIWSWMTAAPSFVIVLLPLTVCSIWLRFVLVLDFRLLDWSVLVFVTVVRLNSNLSWQPCTVNSMSMSQSFAQTSPKMMWPAKVFHHCSNPGLLMSGIACQPYSRGGLQHGEDDIESWNPSGNTEVGTPFASSGSDHRMCDPSSGKWICPETPCSLFGTTWIQSSPMYVETGECLVSSQVQMVGLGNSWHHWISEDPSMANTIATPCTWSHAICQKMARRWWEPTSFEQPGVRAFWIGWATAQILCSQTRCLITHSSPFMGWSNTRLCHVIAGLKVSVMHFWQPKECMRSCSNCRSNPTAQVLGATYTSLKLHFWTESQPCPSGAQTRGSTVVQSGRWPAPMQSLWVGASLTRHLAATVHTWTPSWTTSTAVRAEERDVLPCQRHVPHDPENTDSANRSPVDCAGGNWFCMGTPTWRKCNSRVFHQSVCHFSRCQPWPGLRCRWHRCCDPSGNLHWPCLHPSRYEHPNRCVQTMPCLQPSPCHVPCRSSRPVWKMPSLQPSPCLVPRLPCRLVLTLSCHVPSQSQVLSQ